MKILTFIAITMLSSCYTSLDNTKVNLFSNLNNVSISDKEFEFKSWIGTRNKLGEFMPSINHKGKILFNDNKLYSMSNFSSDTFLIYDFNLEIKDTVASCIDSRLQFNSITEKITTPTFSLDEKDKMILKLG